MACIVDGCDRKVFCRKMCSTHYNRQRKTGTVEDGPKARLPLPERFWKQVDVRGSDECWPWKSASIIRGYGVIGLGGRDKGKILAHRLAWVLTNGELPEVDGHHGAVVMHICDNRLCCNPAHLRVGSQGENVRDMDVKSRRKSKNLFGSQHGRAKLDESLVRGLRNGEMTVDDVAEATGMHRKAVRNVQRGAGWKHVT